MANNIILEYVYWVLEYMGVGYIPRYTPFCKKPHLPVFNNLTHFICVLEILVFQKKKPGLLPGLDYVRWITFPCGFSNLTVGR
jgi:hypothetical protein